MQLVQNFIRKDFAPLSITAGIRVLTPASPLTQTFDSVTVEIKPNREGALGTPCCILPDLMLKADDGSLPVDSDGKTIPYTNKDIITNNTDYPMRWIVGNQDISKVYSKDYYEIVTDGAYDEQLKCHTRGELKIKRNFRNGEEQNIYFDGYVLDSRTGRAVHVTTRPILVSCVDRGLDQYTLVLLDPDTFTYNPFNDLLLEYEYEKSNGIATTKTYDECVDDCCYLHTWDFQMQQAKTVIDGSKYIVKVYDADDTDTELTEDATNGIIEISKTKFTVDCRLALQRSFEIATFVQKSDGTLKELGRQKVGYTTIHPDFSPDVLHQAGYEPLDKVRSNQFIMHSQSRRVTNDKDPSATKLPYPDIFLDLKWIVTNSLGNKTTVGETSKVTYKLADANIGDTEITTLPTEKTKGVPSCNYAESVDGDWKTPIAVASDADGTVYTDTNGAPFLFND